MTQRFKGTIIHHLHFIWLNNLKYGKLAEVDYDDYLDGILASL